MTPRFQLRVRPELWINRFPHSYGWSAQGERTPKRQERRLGGPERGGQFGFTIYTPFVAFHGSLYWDFTPAKDTRL